MDDFSHFKKNLGFWVFLVQQNMVETTLPDGLETSGRREYRLFWHPLYCGIGATIRISQDALSPVCGIFFNV